MATNQYCNENIDIIPYHLSSMMLMLMTAVVHIGFMLMLMLLMLMMLMLILMLQSFISDCPDGRMDKTKMREMFSSIAGAGAQV